MNTIAKIIATGFGSGYSIKAPGTAGAFVALVLVFLFLQFSTEPLLFLVPAIVIFTVLGVWSSNVMEKEWGHDASKIVVDEMVGIWLALLFIPTTPLLYLIGFALFRFFDILKPLGIRKMERLPRGYGVMGDDIVAGIYANVTLHFSIFVFNYFSNS